MYKTESWRDRIEPVEVVRTTENSVYLPADVKFHKNGERRQQRFNDRYESFFETWEAARDFLIAKKRMEIDNHETTLQTLNKELDKLLEMRNEVP